MPIGSTTGTPVRVEQSGRPALSRMRGCGRARAQRDRRTHGFRRLLWATIAALFGPNIAAIPVVNPTGVGTTSLKTWGEAISPGFWGQSALQTRYRSALVAALAGASLLAVTLATDTAFARGVKTTQSAKAAGKTAKASGKKVAGKKDKSAPDKSAVPQIPLAQGPAPQTSA